MYFNIVQLLSGMQNGEEASIEHHPGRLSSFSENVFFFILSFFPFFFFFFFFFHLFVLAFFIFFLLFSFFFFSSPEPKAHKVSL